MQQSRTDFDEAAPRTEVTSGFSPADRLGFSKIAAWVFREVIRFRFNSDLVAELSTDPSAEAEWFFCRRAELDGRHLKACLPLVVRLSLCVRGSDRSDGALAMPAVHRFAPRGSLTSSALICGVCSPAFAE